MGRVQHPGVGHVDDDVAAGRVSILTRPVGRVQRRTSDRSFRRSHCFNPHPARGPSATTPARTSSPYRPCPFQSSPGPWAECNLHQQPRFRTLDTPFQSSPGPWAECNNKKAAAAAWGPLVFQSSPGPWAECNRVLSNPSTAGWCGFNPHPARGPSATSLPPTSRRRLPCFNPHPARGPSATFHHRLRTSGGLAHVSILTRPVGRVQPCLPDVPALGPLAVSILTRPVGRVQPSATSITTLGRLTRFNPHPARGPSATRDRGRNLDRHWFQSSPGPWAECNATWYAEHGYPERVSILTRPVGRVQLPYPFFLLVHREPPQPWQSVSTFWST